MISSKKVVSYLFLFYLVCLPVEGGVELRLLTWEGYAPAAQVERFKALIKEKYDEDLEFKISYVSSSEEYFYQLRRKRVDILTPSHNIIKDDRFNLIEKGLLLAINLDNIPNYFKLLPSLQWADYCTVDANVYSVALAHGPYGLAYNVDKVQPAPTSWNVLWDEQMKQQYSLSSDYYEVNVYITALALGFDPQDIANIDKLRSEEVLNKLTALIKNASGLWEGVDKPEDLEDNKLAAAWGFSFPGLKKQGQHWKIAQPKEGTTGWVDGHALSYTLEGKPRLKRIAEEWINFTIGEQFQWQAIVNGIGSEPVNLYISENLSAEQRAGLPNFEQQFITDNRILWPILSRRQRNVIEQLWEKALERAK